MSFQLLIRNKALRCLLMSTVLLFGTFLLLIFSFWDGSNSKLVLSSIIRNHGILSSSLTTLRRLQDESNADKIPIPLSRVTLRNYRKAHLFVEIDKSLQRIYLKTGKRLVIPMLSTPEYRPVTVNWLCYLQRNVPYLMDHVMILNIDSQEDVQYFTSKGMEAINVLISSLINERRLHGTQHLKKLNSLWIVRQLLTHYTITMGYDTLIIDSDAIIIKDPFPWLETLGVDMVFGMGVTSNSSFFIKTKLSRTHFTVCAGTALYKSSNGTFDFFRRLSKIGYHTVNDQFRLNRAMFYNNVEWTETEFGYNGTFPNMKTKVAVLSEDYVCRRNCHSYQLNNEKLHVVHPYSLIKRSKEKFRLTEKIGLELLVKQKHLFSSFKLIERSNRTTWINEVCTL